MYNTGRNSSQKVGEAFLNDKKFSIGNTKVKIEGGFVKLYLFGNLIAKKPVGGNADTIMVTNAGWPSNTTRDRLNAIGGCFNLSGGTRGERLSATMYLNGEPMENGKWYSLSGVNVTVDAFSEISREMSYEKAPRGYGYTQRPTFAVAGANNTGEFGDSPCPTHVCKNELEGFQKVLTDNGISSNSVEEWKYRLCKWTDKSPVEGFVITVGKKDVAYFGVSSDSRAMPSEWIDKLGKDGEKYLTYEEVEANAKLICEAVNSFQRLKDSNRELIEVLEEITEMAERWSVKGLTPTIHKAKSTLQKVKQLQ